METATIGVAGRVSDRVADERSANRRLGVLKRRRLLIVTAGLLACIYFARPAYPCAIVGIAMMRFRALGVPQPP
jgi:hypothetical protein